MEGDKHFLGYGVPRSFDTAFKRYEAAAKMGLAEACTMLGTLYEFGIGQDKNMTQAIHWYEVAAYWIKMP